MWWVAEEAGALWLLIVRNMRSDVRADQDLAVQTALHVVAGKPMNENAMTRMLSRRSWALDDNYRMLCLSHVGKDLDEGELGFPLDEADEDMPIHLYLSCSLLEQERTE